LTTKQTNNRNAYKTDEQTYSVYESPSNNFVTSVMNGNYVNIVVIPGATAINYYVSQFEHLTDPSNVISCNAQKLTDPGLFDFDFD
jgi:hypothetical protein